ncbi:Uncharacterised protein [Mycobacteroides abscessus subsp. abscessus]|nr:Uncharacterised protein [Mycobacteroides abscessus subsp. abscessus]
MILIHILDEAEIKAPVRIVIIHGDFLPDDAFLLFYGLFRKIRILDKVNQCLQVPFNV